MRLLRLDLIRYGHLTDVVLDFPQAAALQVVHGANEAGKSTALAALGDALFGFGHRTHFDFLHRAASLRLGFALASRDGQAGRFVRRKGKGDTLEDASGQAVPDAALRPFLGGATRGLFERGFGLDGDGLRKGAKDLFESGGDAGESLLAGMGLLHLRAALKALDEEAARLDGDARGGARRRLPEAMKRFAQATRAQAEAMVSRRGWEEAEARLLRVREALAATERRSQDLHVEARRLERLRRVRPHLAALDQVRGELDGLADAPRLPPGAAETLRQAEQGRDLALRDATREAEDVRRLQAERAGLPRDPAVLALAERIAALEEERPVALQAARDLPALRDRVAEYRAAVAHAAKDLPGSAAPEALRDAVPADGLRSRTSRLLRRRAEMLAQRDAAQDALDAALRDRDDAAAALAAEAPPPAAALRAAVEAARAEGPLDRDMATARAACVRAGGAVAAALEALPLWTGDADALARCPLPLPAAERDAAERLRAAAAALEAARTRRSDLAAAIAGLEDRIARLARGETMPTREAIQAARASRDRAWRAFRRLAEGGAPLAAVPLAEADRAGLPDGPLPDAVEALRDAADRLADRRADEAERVADHGAATAELALLRGRAEDAARQEAEASGTLEAARAQWLALWAPAGILPASPEGMAEWRSGRREALRLAAARDEARARLDDLEGRRAAAIATLAAALGPIHAGPLAEIASLADLLALADRTCAEAERAEAAHAKRVERHADAERRLPALRQGLSGLEEALADLEPDRLAACGSLGLPIDASDQALEDALAAWTAIAGVAAAWQQAERRIRDMAAAIEGFAGRARDLLSLLPDPAAGETPAVAVARLAARLARARKAEDEDAALALRIERHRAEAEKAARRQAEAAAAIGALRRAAAAEDGEALSAAIARAARRDALEAEEARLRALLVRDGDGLAEAALRAEAGVLDADAVAVRLDAIAGEQEACRAQLRDLGGERVEAGQAVARLTEGGAAAQAQQAEEALAEARDAAGRFARVHVARSLLRAGVERFRRENETPLLRAAGGHFALLTRGRYGRLVAEPNDKGAPALHAIRDDGTSCPMDALSEGTRDQLYLALRVAAIEAHAAQAEPLPFIADDLLVHFDDARAAAAIDLLIRLGRETQVILFTHHDHIAALARGREGAHVQAMPSPVAERAAETAVETAPEASAPGQRSAA